MHGLPQVLGKKAPSMGMQVWEEFHADRKPVRFWKPRSKIVSEVTEVLARGI